VVHLEAVADAEEAEPGAPTQARAPRRPHCAAGGHPYPTVPAAPAPRAGPLCRGSPGLPVAPGDRHVRLPSLRRCWASRRLGRARLFWLLCPRLRRVGPGPGYGALCSGGRARCSRGRRRRAQARYADSIESLVRNNIQKIKTDMANEVIDAGRFDMETTMAERRVTLESMLQARPRGGPDGACSGWSLFRQQVAHSGVRAAGAPAGGPRAAPPRPGASTMQQRLCQGVA